MIYKNQIFAYQFCFEIIYLTSSNSFLTPNHNPSIFLSIFVFQKNETLFEVKEKKLNKQWLKKKWNTKKAINLLDAKCNNSVLKKKAHERREEKKENLLCLFCIFKRKKEKWWLNKFFID